jgi:hypothetical protein
MVAWSLLILYLIVYYCAIFIFVDKLFASNFVFGA